MDRASFRTRYMGSSIIRTNNIDEHHSHQQYGASIMRTNNVDRASFFPRYIWTSIIRTINIDRASFAPAIWIEHHSHQQYRSSIIRTNNMDRASFAPTIQISFQTGSAHNFDKLEPHLNIVYTEFDYDSIMIYGNKAFSKDNKSNTIEAKNGQKLLPSFQKKSISKLDIVSLKKMYKC
ncbi:hypothetical protein CDAR_311 [Caerostris darwini]|uniref:Peptidase M12A domain-containing protein n=1 Tax=Caerostris darwini TaxID=1538125 RepID=A0AAV4RHJ4_9ARAC|nr:hypothetical protein CDAR_311 [Caerostris darwini]